MTAEMEVKIKQIIVNVLMSAHGEVITPTIVRDCSEKIIDCLQHLNINEAQEHTYER